ncbi:MAG: TusE/DsrC/DsvC family sulfur relay protein [Cellvibrionaceae bacterium]|nr:TusE/DsrC/DsvC family sulfur relay protein [Cellvibrionaceae bacterium]
MTHYATDADGYLQNLDDWSPEVAQQIAVQEGISLTPAHWEIINLIREYYAEFDLSPAMRPLVKYTSIKLGADKGKSVYLLTLFPGSPPKLAAKIAGLPRPANCL